MIIYQAISKREFAEDAGISPAQLRKWTATIQNELDATGVSKHAKILPPTAVGILSRKYQVMPRNAIIK